MRSSWAMTTSKVTPPVDEEGADVEEAKEGVAVSVRGRFGRSWASLYLMVVVSMTHIGEKCVDSR